MLNLQPFLLLFGDLDRFPRVHDPNTHLPQKMAIALFNKPQGVSMAPSPPAPRSPLADGLEWAARIMACALLMVGPAVFGGWLDSIWQTKFLFLVGMLLGLVLGGGALLVMTGGKQRSMKERPIKQRPSGEFQPEAERSKPQPLDPLGDVKPPPASEPPGEN
ncbi:MAG: hypothetical protein SFX18_17180 [Pirellulales bacterium]|nr:hypothetical protein [Pirellulales bacterium]